MAQTRIDQFYKVTTGNKNSKSVNGNIKKLPNKRSRSSVIGRMEGKLVSDNSRTLVHKNNNQSSYKINKQNRKHDNVSLDNRASPLGNNMNNSPIIIIENMTVMSPTTKRSSSPDIIYIGSQQRTVPCSSRNRKSTTFTSKTSSPIKNMIDESPPAKIPRRKLFIDEAKYSPAKSFDDRIENSPTKITENKMSPTIKYTSHVVYIESQQCAVSRSGTQFTPKKSTPIKNALDKSSSMMRARKKLFDDRIEELISATINNLNLAKEGAIANNNIDLEKVYSSKRFNYKYNPIDTTVSTKYEINDVVVPTDKNSLHFFLAVVTVLSNPVNCGYFDQDELDFIFSMITLQKSAQALLIRMLKRKHMWHRINNIKYDEISNDLKPIFDELVSRSMFKNNIDEEEVSVLLNLLQADELRRICRESKIKVSGKKLSIQSILTFCKTKPLFPGMVTPETKLRASVNKLLGNCILLNDKVKELVDRIITLLIPNRDPTETLVDVFRMLWSVEAGDTKFPDVAKSDLPIFVSKKHLLNYIEAKNTLSNVLTAIEKKQWDTVKNIGNLAAQRLPLFLESESFQDSSLPHHIRHFMPGYIWLKVLSKSIDTFKKSKETLLQALTFLRMLIEQNCHMKHRKGQWYSELIKIEMFHRKNFEASFLFLSEAVLYQNLTEVDKLDLLERAKKIDRRKSGIDKRIKDAVKMLINEFSKIQLTFQNSKTIEGILCKNTSQIKSSWCISKGINQVYGSVESLALYHYKSEGYIKGVHCEGAFPITLFATLFWNEIYNINVPGAWVSLYQDAPLDLYTSEFYENRKKEIDKKIQDILSYDSETLSKHLQDEFELHSKYRSISQANIFDDSNSFKEVVFCLGVKGVIGICERLIHNYSLWKAGFPDLIVWNINTKQYKIVEVKGPKDSLSTKQTLWLDYLNQLELKTEVCYCKSKASYSQGYKRKHEETVI
ncbi:PREDICTED: fanconi-associated nuclease 1-like [Cyphomyrmex costatus]|uniref:Fanconi-associated nuclease n=1 Tax=Cyphomyrmex costatus TaxID=456900 RepID=A0A151IIV5_9HYME|nr:PREDICTED: fanconi-associated nuclease 1-like [Cyphomyrmex costatus]KYN02574.1 Fanconi-associated nuclease 1 [Cyphomyrmex costatus]